MSSWRKNPLEICGSKHQNATLAYHECICEFDYRSERNSKQAIKFKHCLLADEMRRIDNFELYVIIAVVVGVVLIFSVAAFCSCKWYLQTNSNPCGCLRCYSCKKKKKKGGKDEVNVGNQSQQNVELENGVQAWTPMRLVPNKDTSVEQIQEPPPDETENRRSGLCMRFCLSDPVQDCCEFFDCDIMWRKKSIYAIPIFGRRKQAPLQRRPTRPAPPPPKPSLSVPPIMKYPEPVHEGFDDDLECEPVPEAPPSPEPVRVDQPRAMYVDPFSFLQKPFLKSTKEKASEDEPEALYSKVKDFVFGKGKKSSSLASLNKLGISANPDGASTTSSKKSKYSRTGSLASLHNLSDEQLDKSYNSKRSLSLASLHMVEEEPASQIVPKGAGGRLQMSRSKGSLHNICEDDIHPSLRTDEYIDLEEMSKRMEAKMHANQSGAGSQGIGNSPPIAGGQTFASPPVNPAASTWTPDFITASAYTESPWINSPVNSQPPSQQYTPRVMQPRGPVTGETAIGPGQQYIAQDHPPAYGSLAVGRTSEPSSPRYYPPVPATLERPAVPARIAVGTPVSNTGTLGRPKPVVPPRPGGNSPKPRAPQPPTMGRQPHVIKPTAPPPPPPVTTPIESSL